MIVHVYDLNRDLNMSKEGTRFIRKRDLTKKIHIDSTTGSLNSSSPTHE